MKTQIVTPVAELSLGHRAYHTRTSSTGHVIAATSCGTISVVGPHHELVGSFSLDDDVKAVSLTPDGTTVAVTLGDEVRILDVRGHTLGGIAGSVVDAWFDKNAKLWLAKRDDESDNVVVEVYDGPDRGAASFRVVVEDPFGESAFVFPIGPTEGPVPTWIAAGQDGQVVVWLEIKDDKLAVDTLDDFDECSPPTTSPPLEEFLLPAEATELRRYSLFELEQAGVLQVPTEDTAPLITNALYLGPADGLLVMENGFVYRVDLCSMTVTWQLVVLGHEPRETAELYPGLDDSGLCADLV